MAAMPVLTAGHAASCVEMLQTLNEATNAQKTAALIELSKDLGPDAVTAAVKTAQDRERARSGEPAAKRRREAATAHADKACHTCGERGHISRDCRVRGGQQSQQHNRSGPTLGEPISEDSILGKRPADLSKPDAAAVQGAAIKRLGDPTKCVYGDLTPGGRREGNLFPALTVCPNAASATPCERDHFGMPAHFIFDDESRMALFRSAKVTHWAGTRAQAATASTGNH